MLFDALNFVLQGSFVLAGLAAPLGRKGTPQTTFRAQTLWAEVLLVLCSVAPRLMGFQPYFARSRLAQKQNPPQQHILNFEIYSNQLHL
jgi:hypothetical protein